MREHDRSKAASCPCSDPFGTNPPSSGVKAADFRAPINRTRAAAAQARVSVGQNATDFDQSGCVPAQGAGEEGDARARAWRR